MSPASTVAAIFLVALVPGYLFLRLSEGSRRPSQRSPLTELIETAAVGAVTTGSSFVFWVLLRPASLDGIYDGVDTAADLRQLTSFVAFTLILASGLAVLLAWAQLQVRRPRFKPSVWTYALGRDRVPKGHLPYVRLTLVNGTCIDGVLDSYTYGNTPDRDLSLIAPIYMKRDTGRVRYPYDILVVADAQIAHIALRWVENVAG